MLSPNFIFALVIFATGALSKPPINERKSIFNEGSSGAELPAVDANRSAVGVKLPVADVKSSVGNGLPASVNEEKSVVSSSTNLTSAESETNLTSIPEVTISNLTATVEEENAINVTSVSGANLTSTAANVTSTLGATMTNSSDSEGAASIEKLQGFNETKFISENAVDFSNVPIPSVMENITCERGYRFVDNACQLSKWRRDNVRNLIAPECKVHSHCAMNAICDPDENLCKCVNGLPISATACEGSSFGEKCDDNTECKSWDLDCKEGFCACYPDYHREKEGCVRLIALDNECTFGGTPCYGEHVACLGARGESCPPNTTCACRCENGYEKDQKNKVCVKPKPATESPKSKRAGDVEPTTLPTTTTVMTTTTSTRNDASIMSCSGAISFFIGFALLFKLS